MAARPALGSFGDAGFSNRRLTSGHDTSRTSGDQFNFAMSPGVERQLRRVPVIQSGSALSQFEASDPPD